jgi:hypothetical protein
MPIASALLGLALIAWMMGFVMRNVTDAMVGLLWLKAYFLITTLGTGRIFRFHGHKKDTAPEGAVSVHMVTT